MAPRMAEANQAIATQRRTLILEKALGIFVRRGYSGTRIQEISAAAGLSYGLAYHYFASKEEIFEILVQQALQQAGFFMEGLANNGSVNSPQGLGLAISHIMQDPSPLYFSLILQALTMDDVPQVLRAEVMAGTRRFAHLLATALGPRVEANRAASCGEAILAVMIGTSSMKACGFSQGEHLARAVEVLAQAAGNPE